MDNPEAKESNQEFLVETITKIKHAGVVAMSYWMIIFSNRAVYFCCMGKNAVPIPAVSAFVDVILSQKAKGKNQNLEEILQKSEEHYKIDASNLQSVGHKKGLFGGSITFPKGNGKTMKLKVSNKQYESFLENISRLNNIS